MSISNRCWNVLLNESAENGVFIDANSSPVVYSNLNLDSIADRIQYLFKYSPYHILLSKTSIVDFGTKVPGALEMLSTLCSTKNLNVCSISSGLGEDLIGFLCAVNELNILPKGSLSVGFLNKFESCCHTAKNLFDANNNFHLCNTWDYIHCDPMTTWTTEAENYLARTDAVFLSFPFVKFINTSSVFLKFMKDLFSYVKPGAVVFCFFQKKQDEYFRSKDFSGLILNNPLEVQVSHVPFDDLIIEIIGKKPVLSGSCFLTVWKNKDSGIPVSPGIHNELNISLDQQTILSSSLPTSKISASESDLTVPVPDSLRNNTRSERLLTSLMESLKYLEIVMKKTKDRSKTSPNSSNSLLENESAKKETVEEDSIVKALLSLEESLKRLCYILRKGPITSSASNKQLTTIKAETEFSLSPNENDYYSNGSLSLLIQSLSNMIDKLEHN